MNNKIFSEILDLQSSMKLIEFDEFCIFFVCVILSRPILASFVDLQQNHESKCVKSDSQESQAEDTIGFHFTIISNA